MGTMTNLNTPTVQYSLTTGFKSTLFPLYDIQSAGPHLPGTSAAVPASISSIAAMAINIYCPSEVIDDYEHLLCKEVALPQSFYDRKQTIASVWWLGSPLQQLSSEAITELCFRMSNYFPRYQESTTRGLHVTPMELNKDNLALLKGLNFNAIKLNIDASIAGDDRSLSRVEAALQILADYKSFELSCIIKFSDQTHKNFLKRLFTLLESSHCTHIEVICPKKGPSSLQERQGCHDQLGDINSHFRLHNWQSCGNNNFFTQPHRAIALHKQGNLEANPWGYQARHIATWLGLGVGALTRKDNHYQYNNPSPQRYRALLSNKQSPVETQFVLRPDKKANFKLIQELLCQHRISTQNKQLHQALHTLIPPHYFIEENHALRLTMAGIVALSSISANLARHAFV